MSSPEPTQSREALSRLRIQRGVESANPTPNKRVWWIASRVTVVVLILLVGFVVARSVGWTGDWIGVPDAIRPRIEVRVAPVVVETGRSADALVVATGYLESRRQAMIGARAPGRIEVVNVEEGSLVKQNTIIAVLEHADLEAGLDAARASHARTKADLVEQDVEIARAKTDFDRVKGLYKKKSVSDADYDVSKFQYEAAIARRDSLIAARDLAAARVREAEQLKENMFIRAPFDGTVISKNAEVGESILPGGMGEASGRGSVVTIADLANLEVDCDVKEDYIARVKVGQSAEVAVDAVPDHRYKGRVRKIIPMGDRARATIKVKVEILDVDSNLFPEMSSTVYFLPKDSKSAPANEKRVFCRSSAIVSGESGPFVWSVTEGDRVQETAITIGQQQDERTEITSGLSGGERVVLNPPAELRQKQLVKVAE